MCEIEWIGKVVCTCYLGGLSWTDVRTKQLPAWLLGVGALSALAYQLLYEKQFAALWLSGAMVGLAFLAIGKMTEEALGYGDGVLIGILGIYLGIWNLLSLLVMAFFLAALYAAVLLMSCKFRRKAAFPFVPFLGAAYVVMLATGGW